MKNKINIKFMSDQALATLKANKEKVYKEILKHPSDNLWLEMFLGKNAFIEKKYKINDFDLKEPDKNYKEVDLENSICLYENLKDLPMHILTDERFWAWLTFDKFYHIVTKAMPIDSLSKFTDHYLFTKGIRRSIFFGVLSRCYFRVSMTIDEDYDDKYTLTRFVIEKPERFRNLTWRTYSNNDELVLGALEGEYDMFNKYGEIDSLIYTRVAKYISKLGSVMLLDTFDKKDIKEKVIEFIENEYLTSSK